MRGGIAEKMAKKNRFYCHIVCRLRVPEAGSAGFCCCLKQLFCPLCHRSNCSAVGRSALMAPFASYFCTSTLLDPKPDKIKRWLPTTQVLLLLLEPKIGSWDMVMTWQGRGELGSSYTETTRGMCRVNGTSQTVGEVRVGVLIWVAFFREFLQNLFSVWHATKCQMSASTAEQSAVLIQGATVKSTSLVACPNYHAFSFKAAE